jgi:hypothetical protein
MTQTLLVLFTRDRSPAMTLGSPLVSPGLADLLARQFDIAIRLESLRRLGVTVACPLVGTSFSNRSQSSGLPLPRSQNSRHARRVHIQYSRRRSNDRP